MRYLALLALLVLTGCPLHDPVVVEPDYPSGSDIVVTYPDDSPLALSSPCGRSCANFRKLGCSDGETLPTGVTCYQACSRMVRVRRVPAACWIAADTLDHLRACGPDVRCR